MALGPAGGVEEACDGGGAGGAGTAVAHEQAMRAAVRAAFRLMEVERSTPAPPPRRGGRRAPRRALIIRHTVGCRRPMASPRCAGRGFGTVYAQAICDE